MTEQPEHSDALDSLYEALTAVRLHQQNADTERQELLGRIEAKQKELIEQRELAADHGERDTYEQLSQELATLTRAYRVASQEPGEDPYQPYRMDDEEPQDQPPQEADDADLRVPVPRGAPDRGDAPDQPDPGSDPMPDVRGEAGGDRAAARRSRDADRAAADQDSDGPPEDQ